MFSFIKKKLGWGQEQAESSTASPASPPMVAPGTPTASTQTTQPPSLGVESPTLASAPEQQVVVDKPEPERRSWLDKLRQGLRKTGSSIAQVFTGTQIDDLLYEELEAALLMADAGVAATEFLLEDLKRRVKEAKATAPEQVKGLLIDA
ncbi:MAG TPA: signal recognition particle receptor subunit alpha, partial [Aquabacterium sp.]|nr:signal recognition particle receptor subunit alpha [Aquabacterium sp.]